MRQLTLISGAGANIGVAQACPFANEMLNFTYQKVSTSVFQRVAPEIRAMFTPESFDYILGGLLTVNLAIERTKQDLKRFKMDEAAFAELFRQSYLQQSIADALTQIEEQLTLSLGQMLNVVNAFTPAVNRIVAEFDHINYFTVNFDGIFDHILYGPQYIRSRFVTDFWHGNGSFNSLADAKIKICHLHGDLRYKPTKRTKNHNPPYKWPVLVVGDQEVKNGLIASHESLRFYNDRLRTATENRPAVDENVLAIVGFGFRDEDEHIVSRIKHALASNVFDRILLFDPQDKLTGLAQHYEWTSPANENLISFLMRV